MALFNKKKKILAVDDSEIDLELLEFMLKDKYTVLPTKSGKEALDYLLHFSNVDIILLDLIMPEMDGWETFSRIKDLGNITDVPIAFVTSVHGKEEQDRAKEIGVADYIFKPFSRDELIKRIDLMLKKPPEKKAFTALKLDDFNTDSAE
jgi:putative two-component system response regulator